MMAIIYSAVPAHEGHSGLGRRARLQTIGTISAVYGRSVRKNPRNSSSMNRGGPPRSWTRPASARNVSKRGLRRRDDNSRRRVQNVRRGSSASRRVGASVRSIDGRRTVAGCMRRRWRRDACSTDAPAQPSTLRFVLERHRVLHVLGDTDDGFWRSCSRASFLKAVTERLGILYRLAVPNKAICYDRCGHNLCSLHGSTEGRGRGQDCQHHDGHPGES